MRILYAVQGTGNGHVCRAHEIIPALARRAEVDVLISGIQSDVPLPFPAKYVFKGLSFIFGKKGGIDLLETYKKSRLGLLLKEIRALPVENYDLVISDFEPVSSWACYLKNKPCISLSHQSAVMNKKSPQPKHKDPVGKTVLKAYAPASVHYGFHFERYDENIFTPVIRKQVRQAVKSDGEYYTVYLPAYSDRKILRILSQFDGVRWEVFSKHFQHALEIPGIRIHPIDNDHFIRSMAGSKGVLCGAGFETPAEALFLQKKLMVIPMKRQFEQHCNAAALKQLGVPVMKSLKEKHISVLKDWLENDTKIIVDYPDITEEIIDHILQAHGAAEQTTVSYEQEDKLTLKRLRSLTLHRILSKLAE